MIVIRLLNSC